MSKTIKSEFTLLKFKKKGKLKLLKKEKVEI